MTVEAHEIPDFTQVGSYVTGHGLELGGEDFISFAAYCQAHPGGSWARMLQVIVGESEPQPSAGHERCANCHRWVYRVTSESGTNVGWLHEHTNTATGQQNNMCGYAGELGAVGKPASMVLSELEVWRILSNLIADPTVAPTPLNLRVDDERRPGYAPRVNITCKPGAIADVLRWADIFGIPGTGQCRPASVPGDHASYYLATPIISMMRPHDIGTTMLPGWDLSVRCDLDDYEMATWGRP